MPPVEILARHNPRSRPRSHDPIEKPSIRDGRCDRGGPDNANSGVAAAPTGPVKRLLRRRGEEPRMAIEVTGAGFLIRPLGAFLFGWSVGRKYFLITLSGMASAAAKRTSDMLNPGLCTFRVEQCEADEVPCGEMPGEPCRCIGWSESSLEAIERTRSSACARKL